MAKLPVSKANSTHQIYAKASAGRRNSILIKYVAGDIWRDEPRIYSKSR